MLKIVCMDPMEDSLKALDLSIVDTAAKGLAGTPPRPLSGWVRAVRDALGMTRGQLAQRMGISVETVATLERSEARSTITLASLERLAAGLGGRLVYAIVPPEGSTFEQLVQERALAVARARLERVAHSMALEDQAVEDRYRKRQLDRIVATLLAGSRRILWR
jgi:predicted DNA-binding mobile mystery protein A